MAGVYWGVVLLRDVAVEDRVRMCIGFIVLVMGVLGLISLFRGNPGTFEPHSVLAPAAGLAGALAAHPLSGCSRRSAPASSAWRLATLGLLIFTGTPVSRVLEWIREFRESRPERDPVGATRTRGRAGAAPCQAGAAVDP